MGFHLKIIETLRGMSITGDDHATTAILGLIPFYSQELALDTSMALKLRCVSLILRDHQEHCER